MLCQSTLHCYCVLQIDSDILQCRSDLDKLKKGFEDKEAELFSTSKSKATPTTGNTLSEQRSLIREKRKELLNLLKERLKVS